MPIDKIGHFYDSPMPMGIYQFISVEMSHEPTRGCVGPSVLLGEGVEHCIRDRVLRGSDVATKDQRKRMGV